MSSALRSAPRDTAEALRWTVAVRQPALLIAGVATARALMAKGVHASVVAGMSIGAFGAAVAPSMTPKPCAKTYATRVAHPVRWYDALK